MKKEFDAEITFIDMDNPSEYGDRVFAKLRADDVEKYNAVSLWMETADVPEWVDKRLHVTVEAAE